MCDIVLEVKGIRFYAHSLIMCSVSKYLRRSLEPIGYCSEMDNTLDSHLQSKTAKKVTLDFCEPSIFAVLLDTIYSGQIKAAHEDLPHLITLAKKMEISFFLEACTEYLSQTINSANIGSALGLARGMSLPLLLRAAQQV